MAPHRAMVDWALRDGEDFPKGRYVRGHAVAFEHGPEIRGTASAHVVGNRWAEPGAADPEQLLVAAIASCHMLSFLHAARESGFVVTHYRDEAEGLLQEDAEGRIAVTRVALRPRIAYAGETPDAPMVAQLHHRAHEMCFIANSVKTQIVVEG